MLLRKRARAGRARTEKNRGTGKQIKNVRERESEDWGAEERDGEGTKYQWAEKRDGK